MSEKLNILVADDEKPIREGCERLLTSKGFDVATAGDGRQVLEILKRNPVDIILLDLKMPVMGGEEVLGITREQYPQIPVIIITGHGTIDTAVECMRSGAYDFVTKPFQLDQFLLTINRAADKILTERRAVFFREKSIRNLYDIIIEKSRLKTIINCMANGVMVTNRNMEVVLHNPALMRLLNISGSWKEPFPIQDIIENREMLDTIADIHGGKLKENEFISQEISSGENTLRAISAPTFGLDRHVFLVVVGAVTVLEDITTFKQLDQMKSGFVNMVAHELRGPLASIRQMNNVLQKGLAGPLTEKQSDIIGRENRRINALIELTSDLLNVSRIERGTMVEHRSPTDLAPLIRDTVAFMEPRAEEQGVRISVRCEATGKVLADPRRMEELLGNLIGNAVNYSPDGGNVTVRTSSRGKWLELTVKDTGVGIPDGEKDKIFEKFYRVRHPKTRKVIGTGLGLSIVKGIVEAHNGTIQVESVPEKETTFKVMLPVFEQEE